MANTQDWTNFQGGCTTPSIGQLACLGGWTFTNFVMGVNTDLSAIPYIPPAGDVLLTSTCCGYYVQLLQTWLCPCNGEFACAWQTPTTDNPGTGATSSVVINATIISLTGSPIFGVVVLTSNGLPLFNVTGFGVIVNTSTNLIELIKWNNENMCNGGTVLASTAYIAAPGDKITLQYAFGVGNFVYAIINDSITALTIANNLVTLGDFGGIANLTATGTVDLNTVQTAYIRPCL